METKDLFAQLSIRKTKQRQLLFDLLQGESVPVSAEQIFLCLKEQDADINLSTVYRILELFAMKQLVNKTFMIEDNKAVFELNRMEHKHHLICINCKKMLPLSGCPLKNFETEIADADEFQVIGHKLEIYGYCKNCQTTCGGVHEN